MGKKSIKLVIFLFILLLFLAIPRLSSTFLGSTYFVELMTQAMVYGICALSLNLLLGYLGLPSLGHGVYLGISAYTVAICITKFHMTPLFASLIAICLAAVTASLFGLFALRARGVYFLMITLALAMLMSLSLGLELRDHALRLEAAGKDLRREFERRKEAERVEQEAFAEVARAVERAQGGPA